MTEPPCEYEPLIVPGAAWTVPVCEPVIVEVVSLETYLRAHPEEVR